MSSAPHSPSDVERVLGEIWSELLMTDVAPDEDFFDAGGYSLLVVDVVSRARAAGIALRATDVYEHRTIARLAASVAPADRPAPGRGLDVGAMWSAATGPWAPDAPGTLVPVRDGGRGTPVFVVHWGVGSVDFLHRMPTGFGAGRAVIGIEAAGFRHAVRPLLSIVEMAEYYLHQVREVQPRGPYHLAGVCQGALVALEMARMLRSHGEQVPTLALVNLPDLDPFLDPGWGLSDVVEYRLDSLHNGYGLDDLDVDLPRVLPEFGELGWYTDAVPADFLRYQLVWAAGAFAQQHHHPRPYDGPVLLVHRRRDDEAILRAWDGLLPDREVVQVDCGDHTLPILLAPPFTDAMSRLLCRP